ncbi:hypothetical protein FDP41_000806 [Naegleria fowleri]|uniref:Uncharacterized protein n=1 Tax=Naegleria fowleri TaxID=5763 RepID=A0A6A5C6I1_NAEFO|nr:uncharacterized protein FDP41_000806 [Naegleria fowleri]KAF0984907.1 hypothetical protein FDP41_000806 [Naegleria fowleri]
MSGGESEEFKIVLNKIKSSTYYRNAAQGDENLMYKLAVVLSDKQQLKSFYLTTDWAQSVINAISTYSESMSGSGRGLMGFKSTASGGEGKSKQGNFVGNIMKGISSTNSNASDIAIHQSLEKDVTIDDDSDEEDLDLGEIMNSPEHLEVQKSLLNQDRLRVKIIVSEICDSRGKKAFRQLFSPLLSNTKFLPEMGMFHSAVIVGPWKFEWIDASLCVPKKLVASAALVACDLTTELSVSNCNINEMVDKIADVIIKWNTKMTYKNRGGEKGKEGNCQDFVDEILEAVGVDKKAIYQGAMGAYFERLKKKGKGGMKFFMDDNFRKKFNIPAQQKNVKFKTHTQLDQFVQQLLDIDPVFELNHPYDFQLLKSFDRALWLRHLAKPKIPEWEPLREEVQGFDGVEMHLKCPFGDPNESFSFRE